MKDGPAGTMPTGRTGTPNTSFGSRPAKNCPTKANATAARRPKETTMTETTYPREKTSLLFVDPYNDFLSEGGKVYPRIKPIADEVGLLDNLRQLDGAIRAAGIQVVIVPHRRWEPQLRSRRMGWRMAPGL